VQTVATQFVLKATNQGDIMSLASAAWVLGADLKPVALSKSGFSLYTFDSDTAGASNCTTAGCMANWPPLLVGGLDEVHAPFTQVLRPDGFKQWALRDKPLYLFKGDLAAGDTLGDGKNGLWHLAHSNPISLKSAADNSAYWAAARSGVGEGMSLYTFAKDNGSSTCVDACAINWPPLLAGAGDVASGSFSLISRADSALKQWAYNGAPLYFYSGDSQALDTKGAGLGAGAWQLARPQAAATAPSALASRLVASTPVTIARLTAASEEQQSPAHLLSGRSLYTFDKDTAGVSTCTATNDCMSKWPPLLAVAGAIATGPYSLIERSGGLKQWALEGKPLYLFAKDTDTASTLGDGVGGVWHLARMAPVQVKTLEGNNAFAAAAGALNAAGEVDTSRLGYFLYTRSADSEGSSSCTGACVNNWPPLYASASSQAFGDFSVIKRPAAEGETVTYQWAYLGKALYFYVADTDGLSAKGVSVAWPLAQPQ
jgi:predicted lipoprotein with Yx(FWY)xxD motif